MKKARGREGAPPPSSSVSIRGGTTPAWGGLEGAAGPAGLTSELGEIDPTGREALAGAGAGCSLMVACGIGFAGVPEAEVATGDGFRATVGFAGADSGLVVIGGLGAGTGTDADTEEAATEGAGADDGVDTTGGLNGPGGMGGEVEGIAPATGGFSGPGGMGEVAPPPEGTGFGGSLRGGSLTGLPADWSG